MQPEETSNLAGYASLALIAGSTIFGVYQLVKLAKAVAHEVVLNAEATLIDKK